MALADVYQLRFIQNYDGKPVENVFFYNRTIGVGGAGILAAEFEATIIPLIHAIQNVGVLDTLISVFSLGDLSDFANLPETGHGDISGGILPASDAVSYTFKLNTRAVRPGGKRITGVPESVTDGGIITDATYIAAMNDLRDAMNDNLVPAGSTFTPVVVKRIKTLISGTVPPQYRYTLPEAGDPLVLGTVVEVLSSTVLGSQVSRKKKKV